tara:strand:- start:615 stop:2411 length:1797 start_codon:yes stop_codon:yes gene_type:complete
MAAIISELDRQQGLNGHSEFVWSNDIKEKIVQLTFQLTRTRCEETRNVLCKKYSELLINLFFEENQNDELCGVLLAIPIATRDIISGKGEYTLYYHLIGTIVKTIDKKRCDNPQICEKMEDVLCQLIKTTVKLENFTHPYGSWKDMKYLLNHLRDLYGESILKQKMVFQFVIKLIADQLHQDAYTRWLKACGYSSDTIRTEGRDPQLSLAAKWAPREKSRKFGWQAKYVAMYYFSEWIHPHKESEQARKKCCTHYRKFLADLNKDLYTPQINQCNGTWHQIDFNKHVTSITLAKQKRAFYYTKNNNELRGENVDRLECRKNYENYINDCLNNKRIIKSARVSIVDMVKEALSLKNNKNKIIQGNLNLQWEGSGKGLNSLKNFIALVDTSRSMSQEYSTPLHAAIGLGLRVAENSKLGRRVLTFSQNPQWINLENTKTLTEMANKLLTNDNWGANTNFISAMRLISEACIEKKLEPETVKTLVLIVFSDMQIDKADPKSTTMHSLIESIFKDAGERSVYRTAYKPPHIIYWNLRSTSGFPCMSSTSNISMVSGFSPVLLNLFCEKGKGALEDITPYLLLLKQLKNERYSWVWDAAKNIK